MAKFSCEYITGCECSTGCYALSAEGLISLPLTASVVRAVN